MNAVTCRHYLAALGIPLWLDRERGQPDPASLDSSAPEYPDTASLLASATVQRGDDRFAARLLLLELIADTQTVLKPRFLSVDYQQLLSAMLLSIDQNLSTVGYGSADLTASPESPPQSEMPVGCHGLLLLNQSDITHRGIQIGQEYMLGELPCVTCWHPAELLEYPLKKRQAWAILQRFSRLL